MKNTFFLAAATLAFTAAQAQDSTAVDRAVATDTTKKLNAYGSYSTRDSIAAKYKLLPMPAPLTQDKVFPVLGSYQLNTTVQENTTAPASTDSASAAPVAAPAVTITLDSANKGLVWIEGLPQGKMKAYLRKSPSTYRIIPQTTEAGTVVPEGTLVFDPATNVLNIVLGAPYNEADPAAIFALSAGTTPEDNTAEVKVKTKNTKTKTKLQFYTANKVTANQQQGVNNNFENNLQQAQQSQQPANGNQQ